MPNRSPPTTFHLFPLLAPELRLKIWSHACTSRIVTVCYKLEQDKCLSASKPPAILQASRESREKALKTYKLCFGTKSLPPRVYFNPHDDILYLPRHREMGYDETLRDFKILVEDKEDILNETRRVAIEHVDAGIKRPWESYNKASLLRNFSNLEEVVVVFYDGKGPRLSLDEEIEFVPPKENPENLLQVWANFRQSFAMEEKTLENVCKEMDRPYELFNLPTVKIKGKARMKKDPSKVDEVARKFSFLAL